MAGELYTTSGGPEAALVSQVARRVALLGLASRYSLRNHPSLIRIGDDLLGLGGGLGVGTLKGALYDLDGADLMSSVSEGAAIANTALTAATFTISPADYGLSREPSDAARRRDPSGIINPQRLAMDGVSSASMTLTNLIAKEIDGGTTVGTTGVDMTHDTFLAAQFALDQALVPGPYMAVLKPKQFTDWQADLESRGGVTQWVAATQQMQMLRGEGLKGSYNNIEVASSDQIQSMNAGADWGGGMWGRGAIGYQEEPQAPATVSQFVLLEIGGPGGILIRVTESRTEKSALTAIVTHYSVGTVVIEAARLRTIVSAQ
jgi:hypothetical protein